MEAPAPCSTSTQQCADSEQQKQCCSQVLGQLCSTRHGSGECCVQQPSERMCGAAHAKFVTPNPSGTTWPKNDYGRLRGPLPGRSKIMTNPSGDTHNSVEYKCLNLLPKAHGPHCSQDHDATVNCTTLLSTQVACTAIRSCLSNGPVVQLPAVIWPDLRHAANSQLSTFVNSCSSRRGRELA